MRALSQLVAARANDARALREVLDQRGALAEVVRFACEQWPAT